MFAVVIFTKTEDVEVVPITWLTEGADHVECAWPPFRNALRITKAAREEEKPTGDWTQWAVRILKKYGNYTVCDKLCSFKWY
jgi:hypothetical protein